VLLPLEQHTLLTYSTSHPHSLSLRLLKSPAAAARYAMSPSRDDDDGIRLKNITESLFLLFSSPKSSTHTKCDNISAFSMPIYY
jgi:hypothetical protein